MKTPTNRAQLDLDLTPECGSLFGDNAYPLNRSAWTNEYTYSSGQHISKRVFAVGRSETKQVCAFEIGSIWYSLEEVKNKALMRCNKLLPFGYPNNCQIYAVGENISYLPIALRRLPYITPKYEETATVPTKVIESTPVPIKTIDTTPVPIKSSNTTKVIDAKNKCLQLGFKVETEGLGKCVLQLSK